MCEASLGVIYSTSTSLVDRIKAILDAIPDATRTRETIADSARSMCFARNFWWKVLGDEFDLRSSVKEKHFKKFFDQFSLLSYYERNREPAFNSIVIAHANLSHCTSVEALTALYADEPELRDKIPKIVEHTVHRIDTHVTMCRTIILTEYYYKEMASPFVVEHITETFNLLQKYFLSETSALLT